MYRLFEVGAVPFAAVAADSGILNLDKNLLFTMGIQILNVTVLTIILVFLLYKPVKKFLSDRTKRIKGEIDEASGIHEDAVGLKGQYETLLAGIEGEREEILRQTHKKAMEKSDQMLFEARREVEAIYNRAMAELEMERKNAKDDMQQQIIEISHMMASRFVKLAIDQETQDRMIKQAFADWNGGVTDA